MSVSETTTRLINSYTLHFSAFEKAWRLECQLEDAVMREDRDAEYAVVDDRSDAWGEFDKAIDSVIKALNSMTLEQLSEVRQYAQKERDRYTDLGNLAKSSFYEHLKDTCLSINWSKQREKRPQNQGPGPGRFQ